MAHRTKRTLTAAAKENAARPRLGDVAYQKVLEGLFNRSIPTGAFLSQSDLVKLLDIPVQPLRDALKILEAEGVVTIHPRSGIEFLKLDLGTHAHNLPVPDHYRTSRGYAICRNG